MLLVCLDCTTAFAVGVPRCPHCGSERSAEQGTAAALGLHARGRVEEEPMPKITRHGGASDRHAGVQAPAVEVGEGEQPSAGSSGETSSAKPSTTPEKNEKPRRSRARKTASRSGQDRTGSSSVRSTGGGQEADASATGDSADA